MHLLSIKKCGGISDFDSVQNHILNVVCDVCSHRSFNVVDFFKSTSWRLKCRVGCIKNSDRFVNELQYIKKCSLMVSTFKELYNCLHGE